MSDHPNDAVSVLITLDLPSLCRAARLGGLPIALDHDPVDDKDAPLEIIRHHAKRGIVAAIHESFDRLYPAHYPDDISDPSAKAEIDYRWGRFWRGTAQW